MSALQVDLAVLELLLQKHRLLGGCKLMFNCFFFSFANRNSIGVLSCVLEIALMVHHSSREHAHLQELGLTSSSYGTQMLLQGC
jgi:hypothetical protein